MKTEIAKCSNEEEDCDEHCFTIIVMQDKTLKFVCNSCYTEYKANELDSVSVETNITAWSNKG